MRFTTKLDLSLSIRCLVALTLLSLGFNTLIYIYIYESGWTCLWKITRYGLAKYTLASTFKGARHLPLERKRITDSIYLIRMRNPIYSTLYPESHSLISLNTFRKVFLVPDKSGFYDETKTTILVFSVWLAFQERI